MKTMRLFIPMVAAAFLFVACSDDTTPPPKTEGLKPTEAGVMEAKVTEGGGKEASTVDMPPAAKMCQAKGCTTDADCKAGAKKCITATGICGCEATADCDAATYKGGCDTAKKTCKACAATADCLAAVYKGGCDTATGACLMCGADTDCTKGTANTGKCLTSGALKGLCYKCTEDKDCVDAAIGKFCDTATNTCYKCKADTDCTKGTGDTGKCASKVCYGCAADQDCTDAFTAAANMTCK